MLSADSMIKCCCRVYVSINYSFLHFLYSTFKWNFAHCVSHLELFCQYTLHAYAKLRISRPNRSEVDNIAVKLFVTFFACTFQESGFANWNVCEIIARLKTLKILIFNSSCLMHRGYDFCIIRNMCVQWKFNCWNNIRTWKSNLVPVTWKKLVAFGYYCIRVWWWRKYFLPQPGWYVKNTSNNIRLVIFFTPRRRHAGVEARQTPIWSVISDSYTR